MRIRLFTATAIVTSAILVATIVTPVESTFAEEVPEISTPIDASGVQVDESPEVAFEPTTYPEGDFTPLQEVPETVEPEVVGREAGRVPRITEDSLRLEHSR